MKLRIFAHHGFADVFAQKDLRRTHLCADCREPPPHSDATANCTTADSLTSCDERARDLPLRQSYLTQCAAAQRTQLPCAVLVRRRCSSVCGSKLAAAASSRSWHTSASMRLPWNARCS